MKTLTEFHGILLKSAFAKKKELESLLPKKAPEPVQEAPIESTPVVEAAAEAPAETAVEEAVEAAPAIEETPSEVPATPVVSAEETPVVEAAPLDTKPKAAITPRVFASEEVKKGLGEFFKLEGDKLDWLLHAMEAVGTRTNQLKRVVILQLTEGEKAPPQSVSRGGLQILTEYLELPREQRRDRRPGRGDSRGKSNDKRSKGRGDRDRGDRPSGPGGGASGGRPDSRGAGDRPNRRPSGPGRGARPSGGVGGGVNRGAPPAGFGGQRRDQGSHAPRGNGRPPRPDQRPASLPKPVQAGGASKPIPPKPLPRPIEQAAAPQASEPAKS